METEPLDIERLESPFEPPLPDPPGDRRRWARLYGSGKGLAIAAAARRHRGPCLVIVPNAAEAGRIDGVSMLATLPPRQAVGADAVKRLEAIASIEELSVGFTLATHDLEIRGTEWRAWIRRRPAAASEQSQPVV